MRRSIRKRFTLVPGVLEVLRVLGTNGLQGYVVGGAVRDMLLGSPVSDWDLATDGTPAQLTQIFPRVIPTGFRHGTVTVLWGTSQYELTTFRTNGDYASQHRLNRSHLTRNIQEDLRHRDFTINAMAYDPLTKTLIDPFDGQGDLIEGILRGVEDPLDRFMEDGLRTYRGIRFCATLELRMEARTRKAIRLCLRRVKAPALERVRDEMLKILGAKNPSIAFEMMRETGLLAIALPELLEGYRKKQGPSDDVYHHLLATVDAAPPRPLLRLACLLHDIGKPRVQKGLKGDHSFESHEKVSANLADIVARRLRLSNQQRKYLHQLVENHSLPLQEEIRGPALRRFLSRIDTEFLDDLFILSLANKRVSGANQGEIRQLKRLSKKSRQILTQSPPLTVSELAINGETVKGILGITEGVQVGQILSQLLDIVLEDPRKNNPRDLTALVKRFGQS